MLGMDHQGIQIRASAAKRSLALFRWSGLGSRKLRLLALRLHRTRTGRWVCQPELAWEPHPQPDRQPDPVWKTAGDSLMRYCVATHIIVNVQLADFGLSCKTHSPQSWDWSCDTVRTREPKSLQELESCCSGLLLKIIVGQWCTGLLP